MESLFEKLDKTIIFFIVYSLTFLLFFKTINYTLPFVIAFIFAMILKKPTKYIAKKLKIKNSIASLISTLVFFSIIISVLSFIIAVLSKEVIQLAKNAQLYFSQNSSDIYKLIDKIQLYYKNLDPSVVLGISKNLSSIINKISNLTVSITGKIISYIIQFLTYIPYIIMVILFTLLSTYFFTKDLTYHKNKFAEIIPKDKSHKLYCIFSESKKMLTNYILSYLFIIFITFLETLIVFLLFKVKYALILSLLAAFLDFLPILGIGSIYIPLIIINIAYNNYIIAIGLLISYVLISIIRQIIEPKIVSSSLGLHPVSVLAALFIGLKANGVSGMFFCMFLVVAYNVLKKVKVL
ncbi:pheromone autoinducer 2 transporter [Clostridium acetireducens DSM 10703]|uniref:Pheromone autoinducer 2 transporter n=1 Tax=Clostridium acetireducens DSM 10703 TaxID=1121290 RepID=A0A1E8EX84_9CLOT|nr:sporulation integral membrane protein YtvI [Clostridium acetireducens]OFI05387.1 pheromone autoinducer 2 transporter [Clostridium acetireducens DSM 10703]